MSPTFSCVVPTHRRAAFLGEAVRSLLAQSRSVLEIIVVSDVDDEATTIATRELAAAAEVPVVALLANGSRGASASRNRGARIAAGSHLLFLDDDDLVDPGYVAAVAAVLEADATCDAVVSPVRELLPDGTTAPRRMHPALDVRTTFELGSDVTGSNLVIRRSVFDALGGFDEQLPVQNDADFAVRLLAGPFVCRVLDGRFVAVRHHDRGQLTDHTRARADGMALFYAKHRDAMGLLTRRRFRFRMQRERLQAAQRLPERVVSGLRMVGLADLSHVQAARASLRRERAATGPGAR